MYNLIFIVCFGIFAILMALAMLITSYIVSYKAPNETKSSTYECGLKPIKDANIQFDIKYFNYLIIFIITECSTIFIYPLCASRVEVDKILAIKLVIFLIILLIAIFYCLNKNFLRVK